MAIHVVQLIHNLGLGGAERQLYELCRRLPRERFRTSVVTCAAGGEYEARMREEGIECLTVPKRGPVDLPYLFALRRRLRALAPDILHCWMFTAGLWGALAAAGLRPRPGLLIAERNTYSGLGLLRRQAYHYQARAADRVLGNSRDVAAFWRGLGAAEGKLTVIENGMDFARFDRAAAGLDRAAVLGAEGLDPALPLVLSIGRFVAQKDQATLVEAAKQLTQQGAQAQYAIVGDGPLEPALRRQITECGLEGRFHLLAARPRIEPLLLSASVFCLPSLHEGFPNALAEALGCGRPCVATPVSGGVELIEDGVSGRLTPCGDAGALAQAIGGYLDDPARAAEHGARARERVRARYGAESMAQRYAELYGQLAVGA